MKFDRHKRAVKIVASSACYVDVLVLSTQKKEKAKIHLCLIVISRYTRHDIRMFMPLASDAETLMFVTLFETIEHFKYNV